MHSIVGHIRSEDIALFLYMSCDIPIDCFDFIDCLLSGCKSPQRKGGETKVFIGPDDT